MNKNRPKIALLSPNLNAYSETFIRAHKSLKAFDVLYYFGGNSSPQLEGEGDLLTGMGKITAKAFGFLTGKSPDFAGKQALLKSWRKNNALLILAEYGHTAAASIDVIEKSGLPLVIHFHGYDATVNTILEEHVTSYQKMFAYASAVIAVSRAMELQLQSLGCPKEKIVYNVYGPAEAFFEVKPIFNKKQFITIGRFTNKKAPYYALLALAKVLPKHPDARLVMAGDGYLKNTCENLARYLKIERQVDFCGIVTPDTFRQLLSQSVALLQHSVVANNGDSEGTPLSVLEAGAAGLPVIGSRHAGIPDVVVNDQTGYLFDEHDVETMATQMIALLDETEKARKLGQQARKRIRENFSLERHLSALEKVMAAALNSR